MLNSKSDFVAHNDVGSNIM